MAFADKFREEISFLVGKKNTLLSELKEFGGAVKLLSERILEEDDEVTEKTLPHNIPAHGCLVKKEHKISPR